MEKSREKAKGRKPNLKKRPVDYYSESMNKWIGEWEKSTKINAGKGTPTERMKRLINHFSPDATSDILDEFDELLRDVYVEGVNRGFGKCIDVVTKGCIKAKKIPKLDEYELITNIKSIRMQGTIPCFDDAYQMTVKVTIRLDEFGFEFD